MRDLKRYGRSSSMLVALAVFASACSSSTEPRRAAPALLEAITPAMITSVVGAEVPTPPAVRVKDADGNPVPGVVVHFQLSEGGGQYAAGPRRTDANGEATAGRWLLGTAAGKHSVTVRAEGLRDVTFAAEARPGAAAMIIAMGGSEQRAAVGTALPEAISVRVADMYGNAISGTPVKFSVVSGGGAVAPDHAVTNEKGVASVTWTLGAEPGPQRVEARHDTLSAEFTAHGVVVAPPCAPATPCPAPARIAFSRSDGIHLVNVDGSDPAHPAGPGSVNPSWSPDGTRIAFTRNGVVYTMNADGSNVVRGTPANGLYHYGPDWSADGRNLVFAADGALYLVGASANAGLPTTVFRSSSGWPSPPSWSPDGAKIAFVLLDAVHLINPDGTGLVRLPGTPFGFFASRPDWSPDGRRIAVTIVSNCDWDDSCDTSIAVMNAEGSSVRIVAAGTRTNGVTDPAWSPDGHSIAFTEWRCTTTCSPSVGVVNADGSGRVTIVADGFAPAWRP